MERDHARSSRVGIANHFSAMRVLDALNEDYEEHKNKPLSSGNEDANQCVKEVNRLLEIVFHPDRSSKDVSSSRENERFLNHPLREKKIKIRNNDSRLK